MSQRQQEIRKYKTEITEGKASNYEEKTEKFRNKKEQC